ncbi:PAS domain S-box protein [Methylophilaceae bacterium]|nr:PAS domain S-box protein [Methylophilaceae bacterium]
MTLRLRLNFLLTIIMLIFMLALFFATMATTKQQIREGVESANRVSMQLLDTVITSSIQNPEWGNTDKVMSLFLMELGHVRSNTISLYDLKNRLIYRTPDSTYRIDENPPKWFVKLLAPPMETKSRFINYGRLVVQTNPTGAIKEAWAETSRLLITVLLFFIALNITLYLTLGKWLRPINPMLNAIEKMGKGNFSVRLPKFSVPEFKLIADNFNKMGLSLESFINENNRLALIAEQTADAVIMHDSNLNVSFWNSSAEKMFGYKKAEILGKSAMLIIPKNRSSELKENFNVVSKNKIIKNFETQRLAKNGKLIDVSISASALIDPKSKKIIGDIVSIRDISEKLIAKKSQLQLEKNRQLTAIIQDHIEDERRSLARELHDELGQYVSAIKIFAQNITNRSKDKDKDIQESSISVTAAANQIYDGMHNIIRKLRPGSLDNLGLKDTLKDLVASWQKQHKGLDITLNADANLDNLGEAININVYRIIQEAMNNCLKHANASKVNILIEIKNKIIFLEFADNGVGFNKNLLTKTKQFGLVGIQERVNSLRGKFELDTKRNKGTILRFYIPINASRAKGKN